MNVIFFSTQKFEPPIFEQINHDHRHNISYLNYHLNEESLSAAPRADVACCFINDKISRYVIDGLKERGVKLIALRSAGYNHVDYAYALQKGISVCRVPAYSPHAVAEHAVALILSLNRKIPRAHNRIKEGNFSSRYCLTISLENGSICKFNILPPKAPSLPAILSIIESLAVIDPEKT